MNVPMVDDDQKADRKKILVDYFMEDRHGHDFYALKFFFCEFLNLLNVVGQLFFMNFFLGGEFTTYGADVLAMTELEQEERTDPMSKIFPKVCRQKLLHWHFGHSHLTMSRDGNVECIYDLFSRWQNAPSTSLDRRAQCRASTVSACCP